MMNDVYKLKFKIVIIDLSIHSLDLQFHLAATCILCYRNLMQVASSALFLLCVASLYYVDGTWQYAVQSYVDDVPSRRPRLGVGVGCSTNGLNI